MIDLIDTLHRLRRIACDEIGAARIAFIEQFARQYAAFDPPFIEIDEAGAVRRLTAVEKQFFESRIEPCERLRTLKRPPVDDRAMGTPLRVRWGDLDSYGHVNNVEFFEYVQEGRIAFSTTAAAQMQRMSGSSGRDTMWLVVRQDIEYLNQLAFRAEPYEVRTGVAALGTSSGTFGVEVRDPASGTVYATAGTVIVCADATGRAKPFPQEWKDALAPYRLGD